MIPGVVYGAYKDPVPVAVNPRHISQILHSKTGHNTIFNINVHGGESTPVMVVDGQYDPIKGHLLHVDLKRIDLTKRIRVSVPVLTEGEPRGVKQQGGLLEIVSREIEIECLPDDIPEHFAVEVSELMIGQSKRASDIPMTGSMKLVSSPDSVIAHVRNHQGGCRARTRRSRCRARRRRRRGGARGHQEGQEGRGRRRG